MRVNRAPFFSYDAIEEAATSYFYKPNASAMVGRLAQFRDKAHPAKHASISYGDYAAPKYY